MAADRALPTPQPKPPALLPDAVWRESGPVAGGPGLEYLEHRGVWPGYPVPSVRWLTASAAVRVRLYPRLPLGALGGAGRRGGHVRPAGAGERGVVRSGDDQILQRRSRSHPPHTFIADRGAVSKSRR